MRDRRQDLIITHLGITDRERQILKCLIKLAKQDDPPNNPYAIIATELNMSSEGIRNAMYRLRMRYHKAIQFCGEYREYKKKLGKMRRYLG